MKQLLHKILANIRIDIYDSGADQEYQKPPGKLAFKKSTWTTRQMQKGVSISDQIRNRYGSRTSFSFRLTMA